MRYVGVSYPPMLGWNILITAITALPAIASPGDIFNLGTLGGTSAATGVNDSGQVSGTTYLPNGAARAFRYEGIPGNGGVMRDLGTLGGTESNANGINSLGQVVGSARVLNGDFFHAFRYDGTPGSGGLMRDLGTSRIESFGEGINDLGQIAGIDTGQIPNHHAFLYDGTPGNGGVMQDIGVSIAGISEGKAINNSGQVACTVDGGDGFYHAMRYDGTPGRGGVMRDLGTITGRGGSSAFGINNNGQVVGASENTIGFRYDGTPGSGGLMHALLPVSSNFSRAYAINDRGFVTGISDLFAPIPTMWRPDFSVINLDAWLDIVNPTEWAHWSEVQPKAISNSGLIAGLGMYNDGPGGLSDGQRAFLLDASSLLPEPGSLSLLCIVPITLLRRRARN